MVAPNEMITILSDTDQPQAKQRRFRQIDPALAIGPQELFQPLLLFDAGQVVRIVLSIEPNSYAPIDDLNGFVEAFPLEGGPQNWMPIHYPLPSLFQGSGVDLASESANQLVEIQT